MVDQLFFVKTVKNKIIKVFNFLCFLFFLFFSMPLISDDDIQFVLGINDLPILNKMKNMPESLVIFDTNEGRFIKTQISGKETVANAILYYNEILPNLGWKKIDNMKFKREKELLNIKYQKKDGLLYLTFSVLPK